MVAAGTTQECLTRPAAVDGEAARSASVVAAAARPCDDRGMPSVAYINRRIAEAHVGATVARAAPDAVLWAPWLRDGQGILNADPSVPNLLLVQCSTAEYRNAGPSNRVSRTVLRQYVESPVLTPWKDHLRFVLAGPDADNGERPWPFNLGGDCSGLYSIGVDDLADVVAAQGRGTINTPTLLELAKSTSPRTGAAVVQPFEAELASWPRGLLPLPPDPIELRRVEWAERMFVLQRPTPLGIAFVGRREGQPSAPHGDANRQDQGSFRTCTPRSAQQDFARR
jgi:hypothetical protein